MDLSDQIMGMSKAFDQYIQGNVENQQAVQKQQALSPIETQQQLDVAKGKQALEGVITPEMGQQLFGQVSPEFGQAAAKALTDFKQAKGRDMTVKEASEAMDPVMKGLMMKQAKEVGAGTKEQDQQDKLEKEYADRLQKVVSFRSGGLGLQDSKVNQAIDLRTLLNQYYDPKTGDFNVPPAQHSELALGLARLVSPQGTVPIELEKQIRQSTGREAISKALIYMGADPAQVGGPTQSVMKMFKDSIDRQGSTAERLRNQYIEGLKGLKPGSLAQERADRLNKAQMTSSYNDFLAKAPDHQQVDTKHMGKVAVINPNGQKGFIPAEQLEEAMKAGYKQAQ